MLVRLVDRKSRAVDRKSREVDRKKKESGQEHEIELQHYHRIRVCNKKQKIHIRYSDSLVS